METCDLEMTVKVIGKDRWTIQRRAEGRVHLAGTRKISLTTTTAVLLSQTLVRKVTGQRGEYRRIETEFSSLSLCSLLFHLPERCVLWYVVLVSVSRTM